MDIDRFLARNQPSWDRLAELSRRTGRLLPNELAELVALYERTSTHLSYARTSLGDPALTAQLTRLVASAGAAVYGTRPRSIRDAGRFFTTTFPAAVWHIRRFVLVSMLLTFAPAIAMGAWIGTSDQALEAAAPAAVRQAYVSEGFEEYYSSAPASQFATKVTTNNILVSVQAFAGGILVCVLTAYILMTNGVNVGGAAGLFVAAGQQPKFWGLILPHGLLELSAVVIAGAAGLRLGWTIIDPGDRPRIVALGEEGRRAVVVVMGLALAFVVAGIIEGFVTPSPLPTVVRVGVGVVVELAFIVYVVVQGRLAERLGFSGALGEQERARGGPVFRAAPSP